jgi:hypothetical protein
MPEYPLSDEQPANLKRICRHRGGEKRAEVFSGVTIDLDFRSPMMVSSPIQIHGPNRPITRVGFVIEGGQKADKQLKNWWS